MNLLLALFLLAPPAVLSTRSSVLVLDSADRTRGLCVAVSPSQCVTAYHVVEGHGLEFQVTDHQGKRSGARLGWFDKKKDLALVLADIKDVHSVRLAKRLPEETEDVWTWVIFEDRSIHLFEGKWAGERRTASGTYHVIDGYAEPGTSGGITVNGRGEATSVVVELYNALATTAPQFVRSIILVRPIAGGIR